MKSIKAHQILDSRGNPTVEVDLVLSDGTRHTAAVPSGASTGIHEALELRDNDGKVYLGKGVLTAVANVNAKIAPIFVGKGIPPQKQADDAMIALDGTKNKGKLGANAILGVSMALCKAAAHESKKPLFQHIADLAGNKAVKLPTPFLNVINGGSHAGNGLAMQEFMIAPTGAPDFATALRMGAEVYHNLKSIIKKEYGQDAVNVGDEGGFAPSISNNTIGLQLLQSAIAKAGYTKEVGIAMDVAASEFFVAGGRYDLNFKVKGGKKDLQTGAQMGDLYRSFIRDFGVISIEDPFDQDDWDSYVALTSSLAAAASPKCQIVGDDLLVTNPERIATAIEKKACTALLLKINQIGSISESIQAWKMATAAGWKVMVSHRSGETEDTFIADLVVGLATGQIKTGAPARSERVAKYNQLLRIERQLRV